MQKPEEVRKVRIPHFLTDEDRAWMRRRMSERNIGARQLGSAIGCTRQNVYLILSGVTACSSDWGAIVNALGGVPPSGIPPITDVRLRDLVRKWNDLAEDDRRIIESLVKRFLDKKP